MSLSRILQVRPTTSFYTVKSTHKHSILKTFTHTSIPIHTGKLLINRNKQTKKQKTKKGRRQTTHSTHQTWRLRFQVFFLSNVVVGDGQEAWQMLLRTVPGRKTSRQCFSHSTDKKHLKTCSTHTATFLNNNALSDSLHNNLLRNGINSSPGWLLVTRISWAWWCLGHF